MAAPSVGSWIRIGLCALPLYGLLTLWTTFTHQPDLITDFEAYSYLIDHLSGSILGVTLAIFGAVALGAYLSSRLSALIAMVLSVAGNALILTVFGMSSFATPAVGRAYLEGQRSIIEVNQYILGVPFVVTALVGGLLYSLGTILFGIVVWRSATLPKWPGALYAPTGLLLSIVGLTIGAAQTLAAIRIIVSGGWIAWSAMRRPSTEPVETAAQPRLK